ncbi:unnamed protein product [Onchocerca flexuosa]|uniref:Uncharacterized protein n=1 Tax=Onchocerca flexuosa TaxID=387005 RepID=A0A183HNM6_9BILA|nr:unnamed protein product [Onchocerca flexuosa]
MQGTGERLIIPPDNWIHGGNRDFVDHLSKLALIKVELAQISPSISVECNRINEQNARAIIHLHHSQPQFKNQTQETKQSMRLSKPTTINHSFQEFTNSKTFNFSKFE